MSWLREQAKKGMNLRTYALVGLLVASLIYVQSLDQKQKLARARARAASAAPAAAVAAAPVLKLSPSTPTEPGWGRDPFERLFGIGGPAPTSQRQHATKTAETALWLQGVMNGPAGRTALINGEVYREGERVGSREVLQIGARSVLLLEKGTVTTLTLKGDGS
jgi:hypothetical protein